MLYADKISYVVANPTFDPVIVPGCNELLFRGEVPTGVEPGSLTAVEPIREEYPVS